MKHFIGVAAFAVAATTGAPDCSAQKIKVWVGDTTRDAVGAQLIYSFKDQVRKAPGLELSHNIDGPKGQLNVYITTMDFLKGGNMTAYAVSWTMVMTDKPGAEMYLDQYIGACGSARVEACGRDLIDMTEKEASNIRDVMNGK